MAKTYTFESANKGEVYVSIDGEYRFGTKDISVDVDGELGTLIEDTDDAGDVIRWLEENGVEFESDRSKLFNYLYVQSVLIDGDMTEERLLDRVASMSDERVREWVESGI